MNDLTYEFQRMVSRNAEIQAAVKRDGADAAWEKYSREHGLNEQRFRRDLKQLRVRFESIAAGSV